MYGPTTGAELSLGLSQHFADDTGFRTAMRAVDLLYRGSEWLRARKRIPVDACLRPREWAATMRREWRDRGKRVEVSKPRYTVAELRTLLNNTDQADPRIRRAIAIGCELRAASLRRVMRSDVILDPIGGYGCGRIRVRGEGNKRGTLLDIDPGLRERIDEDFATGDLAALERRYQKRDLADYSLFPGKGSSAHQGSRPRSGGPAPGSAGTDLECRSNPPRGRARDPENTETTPGPTPRAEAI